MMLEDCVTRARSRMKILSIKCPKDVEASGVTSVTEACFVSFAVRWRWCINDPRTCWDMRPDIESSRVLHKAAGGETW